MEELRAQGSRRVGRRGLLLGSLGAAVAGALAKVRPAHASDPEETMIRGDVVVGDLPDGLSAVLDAYQPTFSAFHSHTGFSVADALRLKAASVAIEADGDADWAAVHAENRGPGPVIRSYDLTPENTDVTIAAPSNQFFRFGRAVPSILPSDPTAVSIVSFEQGAIPLTVRDLSGTNRAAFYEGTVECANDVLVGQTVDCGAASVHGQLSCMVKSTSCSPGMSRCTVSDPDCEPTSLVLCVPTADNPGIVAVTPGMGSFEIVFGARVRQLLTIIYVILRLAPPRAPG